MPTLTVSEVKDSTVSDDGNLTSVTFTTKYVGDLDLTMPSSCVDRLIAVLQEARNKGQPKAPVEPSRQPPLEPNQLRVAVPKTWALTADVKERGLVIVVFDHLAETRTGYALSPDAAIKMSEGLVKNAEAVLSSRRGAARDVPKH